MPYLTTYDHLNDHLKTHRQKTKTATLMFSSSIFCLY